MIVFAVIIPCYPKVALQAAMTVFYPKLKTAKPDLVIVTTPNPTTFQISQFLSKLDSNKTANSQNLNSVNPKMTTYYTDYESPFWHFQLGNQIVAEIAEESKIAWLSTGLLSSRLNGSPYGVDPSGGEYDHKLIQLLAENRAEELISLEPELTEAAGENGLRSFAMLLGALANYHYDTKIISYQNRNGFGQLIAEFQNLSHF